MNHRDFFGLIFEWFLAALRGTAADRLPLPPRLNTCWRRTVGNTPHYPKQTAGGPWT